MSWIMMTAPRCRRVVTVCTGAFLAAEAGASRWPSSHDSLGIRGYNWPRSSRPSRLTLTRSISTMANTGPAPASRPASTWLLRSYRTILVSRWPRRLPAGW